MDTKAVFDREAFEAWYCKTSGEDKYWIADRRCEPNSYILGEGVLIYWECWKESRAAIEIVLPKEIITRDHGPMISKERTMAVLAYNGIKVK